MVFSLSLALSSMSLGWQQVSQQSLARASQFEDVGFEEVTLLNLLPHNKVLAQLETQMLLPSLEISFQQS